MVLGFQAGIQVQPQLAQVGVVLVGKVIIGLIVVEVIVHNGVLLPADIDGGEKLLRDPQGEDHQHKHHGKEHDDQVALGKNFFHWELFLSL